MRFSDFFNFVPTQDDLWFDPILSIDTQLFIDPFLLYAQEEGHFLGSHEEVIRFFNHAFRLIARAQGNSSSVTYKKAVQDLILPEVEELCLGYTAAGTRGSGSGIKLAKVIAAALWEAIQAGLEEITHFEEINILRAGIGADRISDITACLLRRRLANYTYEICQKYNIPVKAVRYIRGYYDVDQERWAPIEAQLPYNPYNDKSILLAPRRYLRDLPTINADDFWDYCYNYENETLRREFSYDVTRRVSKGEIVQLARRHPEFRSDYLAFAEDRQPSPYNIERDEKGYLLWYDASVLYCQKHPLYFQVQKNDDFLDVVDRMVKEYRHFIEENAGWHLLWNDNGTSKGEKAAQLLFLGIVKHYCQANNIDISKEPNIGRGPVDFKASSGYRLRALMELKLARNTKFWNGLRKQLPTYMNAEDINCGYFIVIVFTDTDSERLKEIDEVVAKVGESTEYTIKTIIVDATVDKPTASRL